ncbi:MAG: hypothetical protein HYX36_12295 [Rhizobiales bacterium]|nr:hypothetical protein [Hyphomicrobiales bacterium]
MARYGRLLGLLAVVSGFAGTAVPQAYAEVVAAEQALTILARVETAGSRCNFLSNSLRAELARYLARAEIAAAERMPAATRRSALAAGRAEGRALPCDATSRAEVSETLSAARVAVRAADRGSVTKEQAVASYAPPRGNVGELGYYGDAVKAYYLERKCRHLSASQDRRYWQAIGRIHRKTVAGNGSAAVAALMRRAEAVANSMSCGSDSLAMVQAGFAAAARR